MIPPPSSSMTIFFSSDVDEKPDEVVVAPILTDDVADCVKLLTDEVTDVTMLLEDALMLCDPILLHDAVMLGDKLSNGKVTGLLFPLVEVDDDVVLGVLDEHTDGVIDAVDPLRNSCHGVSIVELVPVGGGSNIVLKCKFQFVYNQPLYRKISFYTSQKHFKVM